ncbi:MAG: hypothetical protein GY725_25830 [bacterium]|nr:hypothetical protein [bacterium]
MSNSDTEPLKIVLLLDALRVERWVRELLEELRACDFVELRRVILNERPVAMRSTNPLLRSYESIDRGLVAGPDDPLALVDVSDLLQDVERESAQVLEAEALESIRACGADVVLRFGFQGPAGALSKLTTFGVWTHRPADLRSYDGATPGFWEISDDNDVTGECLIREATGGDRILMRSLGATDKTSLQRNRGASARRAARLVPRCLRIAYLQGAQGLTAVEAEHSDSGKPRKRGRPGLFSTVLFLGRLATRLLNNRLSNRLRRNQWKIGWRRFQENTLAPIQVDSFRFLEPPPGHFHADPFGIRVDGRSFVFFEDLDFTRGRAGISCIDIDAQGQPGEIHPVLERDYHLSYPFVFQHAGEIYMMPETEENRTLELYRAIEFPTRWELATTLLENVQAADATLHVEEGRTWLFVSLGSGVDTLANELHLYFADSPLGPFTPHPRNPVVSDVTRARPAGTLFRRNGLLIRPGQDCAHLYGWGISLNRVDVLSETDYRETPLEHIDPSWYPEGNGTHTLSRFGSLELIDVRTRVRR